MIFSRLHKFILGIVALISAMLPSLGAAEPAPKLYQAISFMMVGGTAIRTMESAAETGTNFKIYTKEGIIPVELMPGEVSGPHIRADVANIELFREAPSPEAGKPPVLVAIAKAEFPASWKNILLLVTADPSGKELKLLPINQSLELLPEKHLGLINLTPNLISVKVGAETIILEPKTQGAIPLVSTTGGADMFLIRIAFKSGEDWKLTASSLVALDPSERRMALIYRGEIRWAQYLLLNPAPADPTDPAVNSPKH